MERPSSIGAQVHHRFPRAGNFTVVETVEDKDGQKRSAEVQVQITRRAVASAVPADARSTLILERPWAHVEEQRKAAERVGLGELFNETDHEFSDLFGFVTSDPKAAEANGVDTDEGVALYTVPQDLEALVACVGVSDREKATAALQHLLAHDRGGPFALHEAALPDGTKVSVGERNNGAEKIGFLEHQGYLYLRVPGASDPLLALASAASLQAEAGIAKDPGFNAAVAKVGQGDALFYSAGREGDAVSTRFANQIGVSAFALTISRDQVEIHAFAQPRNLTGQALVDALTPLATPPDFAAQLPVGAAFFAKASGAPAILWRELLRGLGADDTALKDRLHDAFDTEVDKLLPSFTGNGAVALYLDAQSLIEALLGEQVASLDRSTFLTVSELRPGTDAAVRAALEHAAHESGGGKPVRGATFWKISDGVQVAIRGNLMFAAVGGAPEIEGGDEEKGGERNGGDKANAKLLAAKKKAPARAGDRARIDARRGRSARRDPLRARERPDPRAAVEGRHAAAHLAVRAAPLDRHPRHARPPPGRRRRAGRDGGNGGAPGDRSGARNARRAGRFPSRVGRNFRDHPAALLAGVGARSRCRANAAGSEIVGIATKWDPLR